jgi:methionyl-tRNA synthetase
MPELLPEHDAIGVEFGLKIEPLVREYVDYLERLKLKDGLRIAMKASSAGNLFFQEQQPWVVLKTDKDKCATILACCVGLVRLLAVLVQVRCTVVAMSAPHQHHISTTSAPQSPSSPAAWASSGCLPSSCR